MEPTLAELAARIVELELSLRDATVAPKITRAASKDETKRRKAASKDETKRRKAAEKARKLQFKNDQWHRSRLGMSLNRYAIA